jgi:endonuclease YncB( thermonuclease family)
MTRGCWVALARTLCLLTILLLPTLAQAEQFTGGVVGVKDGDTIEVMRDGKAVAVRLYGIDCPEKKQPYGSVAKKFTAERSFGKTVAVKIRDTDRYGRIIGDVTLPTGVTLSRELVHNGYAWWYREYAQSDSILARLELDAQTATRGLWVDPSPIPPWEYRAKATPADTSGYKMSAGVLSVDELFRPSAKVSPGAGAPSEADKPAPIRIWAKGSHLPPRRTIAEDWKTTTNDVWIDPTRLVSGNTYIAAERTALMPILEPSDEDEAIRALANVRYLQPGQTFRVIKVRDKRGTPWYQVSTASGIKWINSDGLLGQDLTMALSPPSRKSSKLPRMTVEPKIASLSVVKKKMIFLELVKVQDDGVGDQTAYRLVGKRHGLDTDTIRKIAVEGVTKDWPMP